jgi:LysM repeat protein
MEFEDRNKRPQETSQNLPMAVLISLIGIVCLLLYIGWEMISDDAAEISDLTPHSEVIREHKPIEEIEEASLPAEETEVAPVPVKEETAVQKPQKVVDSNGKTTVHTVTGGETLFSIADRYNTSVETLQSYNTGTSANTLKPGNKLTVPVQAIHTVGPGDILRVVGGKYGVTVDALMKANGKTKNFAERGEKLIIPLK